MQTYPEHLVQTLTLADGTPVTLRPIRAADARIEQQFVRALSNESRYFRFMDMLRELSPQMLKQMTEIDYYNQMALIAVVRSHNYEVQVGVARYVVFPNGDECEFAIVVADGWQKKGIASGLMRLLIESARARELKLMIGEILVSNGNMQRFVRKLGFNLAPVADDPCQYRAVLELQPANQ
jgi:acetyltransferase